LQSVAVPNISTGVYGFPKARAAEIAVREARAFAEAHPGTDIIFVCFDDENYRLYEPLLS
jgi:O-acetyl-ADP-ribose deacetylase (regulator of RNase III)